MTTSRRVSDFVVGATVLVVTIVLIGTVLWLKQADLSGKTRHLVARTRDVGGVALGNPVVIRGVRSGQIESIALGERGWVVLRLGMERGIDLPADPVVLLTASSLFGEWQATITDAAGVPADRELRAAIAEARTTGDTLAGAVLPDIAQLTSVAGRIAGDVAKVADRVQVAFDDQAARELRESIRNFATLSGELAITVQQQSKNLDRISGDVQRGLTTVNAAAANLNAFSSRIDSATSRGELQQIVANSQSAARELLAATSRLRAVAEGLDRTEGRLASATARADSVLAKVNGGRGTLGLLVNDPALYQQSDSLLRELRALVNDVRRNPKRYINVRMF
ncbi:MAG: MlaD family protein [Gemmatimonadota bacterium]|jgi:phospholipid/cholesterol/gamma-HCH transport system substrate-binding protein|nr:MlaD family protein [Gemmatimonadota bacterium]MDQ8166527.1 MlaD family protein [Gemmatimonadota bacterium]MDQ8171901.1 MlaD family protein [Gemmatimonadota bacterium]